MESAKDRLAIGIDLLERALRTLSDALQEELTGYIRDAAIQRFEYTFELAWKAARTAASYMGSQFNSPREVIKYAFKMGWTSNPQKWFDMLDARNNTSHAYDQKLAQEVYNAAKNFPPMVAELLTALKKL